MEWVIALLVIYAAWCAVLYFAQDRMVFPRGLTGPPVPDSMIPPEVERVWIDTEGGARVEGWFVRAPDADARSPAPAVIFAHGNGELIDHGVVLVDQYLRRGLSVLLAEYRGYGRSGGEPSQRAIVADYLKFHNWLVAQEGVDPARIIYHGRSLGTGVVVQLAAQRAPAALVLESPFTSVAAFAARFGAPPGLVRHPFRYDRVLPRLRVPVLILHSADDEIIGVHHGRRLHALTPGSEYVELAGGHNSGLSDGSDYWSAIDRFLVSHGLSPLAPSSPP